MAEIKRGQKILKKCRELWETNNPWVEVPEEFRALPTPDEEKYKTIYIENSKANTLKNIPDGTEAVIFDTFSSHCYDWSHVAQLPSSVKILYLGHDGLGCNEVKENEDQLVKEAFEALPNLEELTYCGYYSNYDEKDLKKLTGRTEIKYIAHY